MITDNEVRDMWGMRNEHETLYIFTFGINDSYILLLCLE